MGSPKDLSGLRFGKLVAIRQVGEHVTAAKTQPVWECRCDACGRIGDYTLAKINERRRKEQGCDVCARGPCVVCGGEILEPKKRSCSADCARVQTNAAAVLRYQKYSEADPLFNSKRYQRQMDLIKSDPARYEDYLLKQRERNNRRRQQPEFKLREKDYRHRTRDRRRENRAAWYSNLTSEERKKMSLRTPEQRMKENESRRKSRRKAREQNALNQLAVTMGKLNNRDERNG